jgi:predicted HAD superfamily Cof-like phosphohydrolase
VTPAEMVREFHETYACYIADKPDLGDAELRHLRFALVWEEVLELAEALGLAPFSVNLRDIEWIDAYEPDLVETADAFADIKYVIYGGELSFGIPGDAVMQEVHESNMSKLGEDGKPIYRHDGKILKGPNFFKPDLKKVLGL